MIASMEKDMQEDNRHQANIKKNQQKILKSNELSF
jgi:hypothetical protein